MGVHKGDKHLTAADHEGGDGWGFGRDHQDDGANIIGSCSTTISLGFSSSRSMVRCEGERCVSRTRGGFGRLLVVVGATTGLSHDRPV